LIWRILIKKLLIADHMGRIIGFRQPVSAGFFTPEEIKEYGIDATKLTRIVPSQMLSAMFDADHPFVLWYWRRLMDRF
jgi:hypothetical protein